MPAHQRDYQRNSCMQAQARRWRHRPNATVVANDFLNQNREFNTVTVGTIFLLRPFFTSMSSLPQKVEV